MKTAAIARKLALAASVAALLPAAARACDHEGAAARAARPAPGVVLKVVDARWDDGDRDARDGHRDWRDRDGDRDWRDRDGDRGWRGDGPEAWRRPTPGAFAWRARERAQLRADYARLDDARARFYAFPQPSWRIRRFEAWYAHEHAELDARWARVS